MLKEHSNKITHKIILLYLYTSTLLIIITEFFLSRRWEIILDAHNGTICRDWESMKHSVLNRIFLSHSSSLRLESSVEEAKIALKPEGWKTLRKLPSIHNRTETSIYVLTKNVATCKLPIQFQLLWSPSAERGSRHNPNPGLCYPQLTTSKKFP